MTVTAQFSMLAITLYLCRSYKTFREIRIAVCRSRHCIKNADRINSGHGSCTKITTLKKEVIIHQYHHSSVPSLVHLVHRLKPLTPMRLHLLLFLCLILPTGAHTT